MPIQLIFNSDVQPLPSDGEDFWQSIGDDPFFDLRFQTMRKRFVVAYLKCDDTLIDPRAYINRGSGYKEKDTIAFNPANRFVFVADVGGCGLIRSFRIDPAGFPCRFEFSVEAYGSASEAERKIESRLATDMVGATRCDLGRLPRFKMPSLSFRRAPTDTQKFVDAHYDIAKSVRLRHAPDASSPWLSVIVPVYNAPGRYLDDLVGSFEKQAISGTELILSDDASTEEETLRWYRSFQKRPGIRIVRNAENGGIAKATNAGLVEATGKWVALLDHDDVIAPHAFKMIRQALDDRPDALFLYTDEVVVSDALVPTGLMLKPAYDPVLLTGVNYINHFSVYRHDRLREIGYVRTGFDGSQDYDLLLRYLEDVPTDQVLHLPYPAYWWRRTGQTYSHRFIKNATEAARRAITEAFERRGRAVTVQDAITPTLHRVQFRQLGDKESWPKISIIIPNRDSFELITRILDDLFHKTEYPDLEVLVIDNGSTDDRVLNLYAEQKSKHPGFTAYVRTEVFNFARSINRGLSKATGEHFLILNNDVEVIDPDWLKELVSCLSFTGTGIVGAKLLYPNGKIQHAGVIAGFGGAAGHWYLNKPSDYGGPMNRLHLRNSMTCVTGAVMLVSGDCARQLGEWDEENFAVAYNDVDYCLRAYKAGFRTIWTPFACLIHHESVSRGSDMVGERKKRFDREKDNLKRIHGTMDFEDPAINPGYEKRHSSPGFDPPKRAVKSRTWNATGQKL